jgi:hypothetical protein
MGTGEAETRLMSTYMQQRSAQPVISIPQPGETKSQYVPHAVRLANGDILVAVKGDESVSIHLHRSIDGGRTFMREGVAIAPTPGAWDSYYVADPLLVLDGQTLHYYYKGNSAPGYGGMGTGHATADASTPLQTAKDAMNPVMSHASAMTMLGLTELRDVYLSDYILDPWGVTTFFGGFWGAHGSQYQIIRLRSGGWSGPFEIQSDRFSAQEPYDFVQAPTVFKDGERYVMLFTEGYDGSHDDYRFVTSASCPADGNWVWQRGGAVALSVGPADAWDGRKAFAASVLKGGHRNDMPLVVDGYWQLYYSGSSNASPNTAQSGVACMREYAFVTF